MTLALCLTILKHFWHLFAMKRRVCWLKSPENGRKLQNGKSSETQQTKLFLKFIAFDSVVHGTCCCEVRKESSF